MARTWAWGCLIIGGISVAGCHVISPEHLKGERPAQIAPIERVAKDKQPSLNDSPLEQTEAKTEVEPKKVPATTVSRTTTLENLPASEKEDLVSLAVDAMAEGNDKLAAKHLEKHLKANPDQIIFRKQLAESLFKLERFSESRYHFEKFDEYAAGGSKSLLGQRIHCHTRLMEIALTREDQFAERLHRGIGLYLIACEVQSKADNPSELSADAERLWCRAAKELSEAHKLREEDTRSLWYSYLVWMRLDQSKPAMKSLKMAAENVAFSPLPSNEDRELRAVLESQEIRTTTVIHGIPR